MTPTSQPDPFEDEIRRALALEADEPAPERLVARVAATRRHAEPRSGRIVRLRDRLMGGSGPTGSGPAWQAGFGLVAFAILVVAGGILLRGVIQGPLEGSSPVASGPVASGNPSPTAPTSPPASATPTPGSSSVPSPTPVPSGGSSTEPGGGPVPPDFQPVSVTFVSATDGWLLGTATCDGQPCATIVRTLDGGATWATIPAPNYSGWPVRPGSYGVRGIRFANTHDGWVFGGWALGAPSLWATHDGGVTWHSVTLPGVGAGTPVMALETGGGRVHVAFGANDLGGISIATSPIGTDAWTVSPTHVDLGAGPVPAPQIVLQGSTGWLVEVDRTVIAGARLVNGAWTAWQPPCLGLAGPATLAAASSTDLVAACDVGVWSTPTGVHLYASANGGASFTEAASKVPVFDLQGVAAPSPSVIVVGGSLSGTGSALVRSTDGGATWAAVERLNGAGSFSELGFTTPSQGVVIEASADAGSQLLMTRDGGLTWTPVKLAG